MKKLLFFTITILFCQVMMAQTGDKYSKAVYLQFGGAGYNTSLNYDMRFIKGKADGLGFKIGVGYFQKKSNLTLGDNTFQRTTVPLELNYLYNLRNNKHFIDFGIAYVPHFTKDTYKNKPINDSKELLHLSNLSIGYRFQKQNGLFGRVSYDNTFQYEKDLKLWSFFSFGSVALGYTF